MPKLLQHLAHGITRAKSFLSHGYHTGRKVLGTIDLVSRYSRRLLAAAQPMLQDLGVADSVNRTSMKALSAYDEAKSSLTGAHARAGDHYRQIATAVGG